VQNHEQVSKGDIEEAIAAERRDYQYSLNAERIATLKKVSSNKQIENTPEYRQLLHNLSIIQYSNHEAWYDLNPLVKDLILG
jgi:hypothetical protein